MALRINGLGQGPLADRRLLGERQQRQGRQGESAPRPHPDRVERRHRPTEQLRAEFAALNSAAEQAEDALAITALAGEGLARVDDLLAELEARLAPLAAEGAERPAPGDTGPPDWLSGALAAITEVAETTRFGPLPLLDGSLGGSGQALGDGLTFVRAGPEVRSSPPQGYEVMLSEEPVRATVLGEQPLTPERIARRVELRLREGGHTVRLVTRPGQSAPYVAAALQAAARAAGLALGVEATADGRLLVQHLRFGAAHRFAVASSLPGVLSAPQGGPRRVANGRDIAGTLHGEPAYGEGQTLTGCAGNPCTDGLVVRYTGLPFTGATGRLPRSRRSPLEPRLFAGRVVVAQRALRFRLGSRSGETVSLCLDSVRPEHLGQGLDTPSGFGSLADVRAGTARQTRDALSVVRQARSQVQARHRAVQALTGGPLGSALARLRVQAQNVAAASPAWPAPGAALQAVRALRLAIQSEGREALAAQVRPPQAALLSLLRGDETGPRGPR